MATAKKVAIKKAPAKKATVVKKTPVRRNTRKAKSVLPDNIPNAVDLDLAASANTASEQAASPAKQQYDSGVSLEGRLAEIEVIDLRKLPPVARVGILSTLDNLGYLERATLQAILENQSSAKVAMFAAEALQLNHTNKLVSLVAWEEVKDSYAISRCNVDLHVALEFSTPGPVDPDYMSFGDSHYVRVPKEVRDAAISALGIIRKGA